MTFKITCSLWRQALSAAFMFLWAMGGAQAQCQGTDFIESLKVSNPKAYDKLLKEAAAMPFSEGKFFSIQKEGYAPSYIFGTMHSGDTRITQFSPKLLAVIDAADAIAFELKEVGGLNDPAVVEKMGATMIPYIMANEEEKVDKLFTPEEKSEIVDLAQKYGLPPMAVDLFKPSFIGITFSVPVCEAKQQKRAGVDTLLAQRAANRGKVFTGLETIEEQLAVIANHTPEVQRSILWNAVQQQPISENMFETMISLYQKGHIGLLVVLSKSEDVLPSIEGAEDMETVMVRLVDERNKRMFERSLPMVQNGNAFIAVGAAHLPGETGLLKLYENAGYKVERIE